MSSHIPASPHSPHIPPSIDAHGFYLERTKTTIYLFTGKSVLDDFYDTAEIVADKLRLYMRDILVRAGTIAASRRVVPEHILKALFGQPQYYSVKRQLITKKFVRSLKPVPAVDPVGGVSEGPLEPSRFEIELNRLDDGSEAYIESESTRRRYERLAAELTDAMTAEEYKTYAAHKSRRFISDRPKFMAWLALDIEARSDTYIILGYLCRQFVYRCIDQLDSTGSPSDTP